MQPFEQPMVSLEHRKINADSNFIIMNLIIN